MKTLAKRGMYVLGALAGLALLGPGAAQAQQTGQSGGSPPASQSGGPGTLGTEVPNDSAVAQGYYHSRTRVQGESDRQLADAIQQLLTENQRAMAEAKQAAQSSDPELAKAAQEVVDARGIADFNLKKGAQESGFELGEGVEAGFAATGSMGADSADLPSYGIGATGAVASTDTASEEASGSTSEEALDSTAQSDVQEHASTVGDLLRDARDANRLQLASALEVAQKALDGAADAMSSVASAPSSSSESSIDSTSIDPESDSTGTEADSSDAGTDSSDAESEY